MNEVVEIQKGSWHYRLMRWANGPTTIEVCPSCGAEVKPRCWITKYQLKEPESICGYAKSVIISIVKILLGGLGLVLAGLLIGFLAVLVVENPTEVLLGLQRFLSDPLLPLGLILIVVAFFAGRIISNRRISGWFIEYMHALRQRVCIPVKYIQDDEESRG